MTVTWHKYDVCHKCGVASGHPCMNLDTATEKERPHDNRPRVNVYDGMCLASVSHRGIRLICTLARTHRNRGVDHTNGDKRWPVTAATRWPSNQCAG